MSEQHQIVALKMDLSELTKQIDMKLKARLEKEQQQQEVLGNETSGPKEVSSKSTTPNGEGGFSSMIVTTQMKRNGSKRYDNTAWQSHSDRKRTSTNSGGSTPQDLRSPVAPTSFSYTATPPASTNQGQRPVTMASFAKPGLEAVTLPTPASTPRRGSHGPPPPPPPRNYGEDTIAQSRSVPDLSGPSPAAVKASGPMYHDQREVQRQLSEQSKNQPVPTDGRYQKLHVYLHGVPPGCVTSLTERERMFALEAKFAQIKEIFEAVGVEVPW